MGAKKVKFVLIFLVLAVFLVSGQQGCAQPSDGKISAEESVRTSASNTGFDFVFFEGDRKVLDLVQGEKITVDKTTRRSSDFFVRIKAENYGKAQKSVNFRLRDDFDDSYEGVGKESRNVLLQEAIFSENNLVESKSAVVEFGTFNYFEYPIDRKGKITATATYKEQSIIQGHVSVPKPESETIQLVQPPMPLTIGVFKELSFKQGSYGIDLAISISRNSNFEVAPSITNFEEEGVIMDVKVGNFGVSCEYDDPSIKLVKLKGTNTKVINCHSVVPLEESKPPLLITLVYGVKLEKSFTFELEVPEELLV